MSAFSGELLMKRPAYGAGSLPDVRNWAFKALGLDSEPVVAGLVGPPSISRLVILVFDGLGANQVGRNSAECKFINELAGEAITSTFPSTTGAGLTSLCTGVPPGLHGIVGYVFLAGSELLNVVKYRANGRDARETLDPSDLQPYPTIFEDATARGAHATIVAAAEFEVSGFSGVFLRGGTWDGWSDPTEIPRLVARRLPVGDRALVYAYYDGVDRAAHEFGMESAEYLEQIRLANSIAEEIAESLGPGEAMVVTADHGMVEVPVQNRAFIEPAIEAMCSSIGGEGRCRFLYALRGADRDLADAAKEAYSSWAWVLSRDEVIDLGLFGSTTSAESARRIGDILVCASEPRALFRSGQERFIPHGNHGSLTEDEVLVPFKLYVGN